MIIKTFTTKMFKVESEVNFKNSTLVIPSVSVGNVAQLTVDLIINTLNLEKCGFLWHPNIVPCVGKSEAPTSNSQLTTACELFHSKSLMLYVLQIRSTYGIFETIENFLIDICCKFKNVVILTGTFAYERKDIHLVFEPIRYITNSEENFELPKDWKTVDVKDKNNIHLPGSGIADRLYNALTKKLFPAVIIVHYVSEGDNRPDAFLLANFVDSWLKLLNKENMSSKQWKAPHSWDSLFGGSPPEILF